MSDQLSTDSQQKLDFTSDGLSPAKVGKHRQFRTAVPFSYFSRLEHQAGLRGTTAYFLAGQIIQRFLDVNYPEK